MNLNLEYYKVFYYVAHFGSITHAAQQLCISQPAVSQAVKQLEQGIGCPLFLRGSKGVRLTKEGELLYEYVKQGVEMIWQGEQLIGRLQGLDFGEIRIGASDMTLQFYLLPFLEEFHREYPKIKIMVSNAPTSEALELLSQKKIDFAVVSTPFVSDSYKEVRDVKKIRNVFVAGNQFSHLKGKRLNYTDLKDYPCIFLEKTTSTRGFMDHHLLKWGIELEPEFELATSDMIVQFARRNLGIGCVVEQFVSPFIQSGELFELQFCEEMPPRYFSVVTDRKNPITPSAKKLLQLMVSE